MVYGNPRQVAEQNAAYRRGIVMGLTMAEAGILIIFVLLLLIGFNEWVRTAEHEAMSGKVVVGTARLSQLEAAERGWREAVKSAGLPETATDEEIRLLMKALQEAAGTPAGESALREAREALNQIRQIRDQIEKDHQTDLGKEVERQAFRIANQEGQLKHLQNKLEKAGFGKGERPCWVKPDGTIEFLFDVVLASDGIRMRENLFPSRGRERAALPMPVTDASEVLTESEFVRRTQPLYDSSLAANCRFFVTIFDATGPAEKDLYKSLLRTVEGHFYKRLSNERAPF
jgi:hypothetical protein